jgi:bioY family protein
MDRIRRLAYAAEFAALFGLASFFVIPVGPVPITLQVLLIAFVGLFLGPRTAVLAVILYLLAGAVGLPIFAGGKAGLGILFGPSGGYLVGFLFLAFIAGLARKTGTVGTLVGLVVAVAACHACGIIGMSLTLNKTLVQAFYMDLVFVPADLVKVLLAFLFWRMVRHRSLG